MSRSAWHVAIALCAAHAVAMRARAQSADTVAERHGDAADAAREGMLLPALVAPAGERKSAAVAHITAGYDSASDSPVMRAVVDAAVVGPLDLRFGFSYAPNALQPSVQPHLGLRVKLLSQTVQGIDAALAVFYRMDRFTDDEGLVQGLFAVGRRFGRVGLFANLAYGQDPEGDDRDGNASVALLYTTTPALQLGLESQIRFDLFSDDPRRATRKDAALDFSAGPVAHYSLGPLAVLAQLGLSAVEVARTRVGVIALGGVGGVY